MTDDGGDVLCDQEELQGTSLRRELPASKPSTSLRRKLPASKPSDFQNKNVLPPAGYEQQREVPEMEAGDEIKQRQMSSCTWKMSHL